MVPCTEAELWRRKRFVKELSFRNSECEVLAKRESHERLSI
jgi:hypothetical protein